jgi:hypothetical protein
MRFATSGGMKQLFAFVLAALAACSDSPDLSAPDASGGDPSPWVGNWTQQGTQSTTCGTWSGTNQLSGLVVISLGPRAGTIRTRADDCALIWDLEGATASLERDQICTVSVDGNNVTIYWTQSTATVNGATITATNTGAANNGCSFMQQVTLTRLP